MHCDAFVSRRATTLIAVVALGVVSLAAAQYQSSYPYSSGGRSPAPRLPNSAQRVGGFTGNPYRQSQVAGTGLPLGGARTHSYFGNTGRGGSPVARQPVQKPFSNIQRPRPLITSQEAGRIEVARGLWRY